MNSNTQVLIALTSEKNLPTIKPTSTEMSLTLAFKNVPHDIDLSITTEDISMARDIGILTPREVVSSDFVPVKVLDQKTPSWANKTTGMSTQESHDADYLAVVHAAEYLAFEEAHEAMLDDLAELWEADLDGSIFDLSEPFGHKSCRREILPSTATEVVRVTAIKAGYYIGSIGGLAPNVYIKTRMPLDPHSIYLMDITATPLERFSWRATKVYPKLSTADMLVSCVFIQESSGHPAGFPGNRDETSSRQYLLPTPPSHIGTMVGRKGKNIASLIESVNGWDSSESFGEPDITITPTNDFAGCIVTFHEPPECFWKISDIEWLISHFHC